MRISTLSILQTSQCQCPFEHPAFVLQVPDLPCNIVCGIHAINIIPSAPLSPSPGHQHITTKGYHWVLMLGRQSVSLEAPSNNMVTGTPRTAGAHHRIALSFRKRARACAFYMKDRDASSQTKLSHGPELSSDRINLTRSDSGESEVPGKQTQNTPPLARIALLRPLQSSGGHYLLH
jgi:hypothetical protein